MQHFKTPLMALAAAAVVVACGGGGSDTTPQTKITSVKVFGDSLADVGTFGYKFTVQGTDSQIYPERVAQAYGVNSLCSYWKSADGVNFSINPTAGCTGYAVGGGRINNTSGPTSPYAIRQQLATAGALGNYSATDLLVIDGGGNDAADLVGAYLKAKTDSGATFLGLIGTLVPTATAANTLATPTAMATMGGAYMTALADAFYASIKTNALDKGATNVLLLNMPGITNTPRFQTVLDSVAAASGGGTAGATARAQAEGLFNSWVVAFNKELAAKAAGNSSVMLSDQYTAFIDEVTSPAQFSLQNVKTPACPITGQDSSGLPSYTFPTCTATALSATTPPTGATGGTNWWTNYLFSDSFHPTPYGHKLVFQRLSLDLAAAGRL